MMMLKGLILAGERADDGLWLTADTRARQLVPVANKPILFYGLEAMQEAGVLEVGVMVNPSTAQEIREAVGDGAAWGVRVTYIDRPEPHGVAHALLAAESFLGDDTFLVHFGDGLLRQSILPLAEAFLSERADAFLLVRRVADAPRQKVTELDNGHLLRLVEKALTFDSNLALAGVYMFSPAIVGAAREISSSRRGKLEISDAIDRLVEAGGKVRTRIVDSWWGYSRHPESLLEANRLVLDDLQPDAAEADLSDAHVQGRIVIHRSAKLESTTVHGPAIIGAGACLADSYIGPYTSIGNNVVVEGAEIEDSIILPGATVKHLGGRLEGSVVGSGCKVVRDFALPNVLRLWVGKGAEISLV